MKKLSVALLSSLVFLVTRSLILSGAEGEEEQAPQQAQIYAPAHLQEQQELPPLEQPQPGLTLPIAEQAEQHQEQAPVETPIAIPAPIAVPQVQVEPVVPPLAAAPIEVPVIALEPIPTPLKQVNPANQALFQEAFRGNLKAVEAALKAGADVNHADDNEWTALMLAAIQAHSQITRLLIKAGADINRANHHGDTALMLAADFGPIQAATTGPSSKPRLLATARLLIEHGARMPTEEELQGRAKRRPNSQDVQQRVTEFLRNIFEGNKLAYAAARGDTAGVHTLLATLPQSVIVENIAIEGQPQPQSPQAQSVLQKVRKWLASYAILPPSLPQPLNINRQDTHGITALHWAAAQGQADITRDLLGAGANFRLTDTEGLTPYGLAERNRNEMTRTGNPKEAQRFQQVMDAITDYLTRGTAEMALESAFRQLTQKGQATGTAPAELIQMIIQQNIPRRLPLGGGSR